MPQLHSQLITHDNLKKEKYLTDIKIISIIWPMQLLLTLACNTVTISNSSLSSDILPCGINNKHCRCRCGSANSHNAQHTPRQTVPGDLMTMLLRYIG